MFSPKQHLIISIIGVNDADTTTHESIQTRRCECNPLQIWAKRKMKLKIATVATDKAKKGQFIKITLSLFKSPSKYLGIVLHKLWTRTVSTVFFLSEKNSFSSSSRYFIKRTQNYNILSLSLSALHIADKLLRAIWNRQLLVDEKIHVSSTATTWPGASGSLGSVVMSPCSRILYWVVTSLLTVNYTEITRDYYFSCKQ